MKNYNHVNIKHYNQLITLRRKYQFAELLRYLKLLQVNKKNLEYWMWISLFSKNEMERNDFWIFVLIFQKEKYMSIKNALEDWM